jgi:hypothetical protein
MRFVVVKKMMWGEHVQLVAPLWGTLAQGASEKHAEGLRKPFTNDQARARMLRLRVSPPSAHRAADHWLSLAPRTDLTEVMEDGLFLLWLLVWSLEM